MERKNLLGAASALLVVILAMAMTEEEEIAMAIQLSQETASKEHLPPALSPQEEEMMLAIRLSEESAKKEQEAILKPGLYQQYVDIRKTFRPGLPSRSEIEVPFKVYQIAVKNPQTSENVSCGPRVLFMAHAIDALHAQKRPISTNTIDTILSKNDHYTNAIQECVMQLESDDFQAFIKNNNLRIKEYYVMGRNVTPEGIYPIIPYVPQIDPSKFQHFEMSLKILGQELESDRVDHPIHFIFSDTTKTHWVLISVIKGHRTDPVVYYIDPKNVDINSYVVAQNYIEYVVDKLELPFPKKK